MSHEAVMTAPLSRPKIHRLPASVSRPSKSPFRNKVFLKTFIMLTAAVAVVAMIGHLMTISKNTKFSMPIAVNTAKSAPVSQMLAATSADKSGGNTIVLTGGTGTIVGQMAKIPAQNEQITEVKPLTEVDNRKTPELITIIGKY